MEATTCDDLSEGEVISSETSDKEAVQPAERSCEVPDDEGELAEAGDVEVSSQETKDLAMDVDDGWQVVEKGGRKRQSTDELPKSHKKKKRRRSVAVREIPVHTQSKQPHLTNPQKQLLRHLCQLVNKVKDPNWPELPMFKTVDLQCVLRYICTGSPTCDRKLRARSELLFEKRVVMVWLSMVSETDFLLSDDAFNRTKSLPGKVIFTIQHPGSSRFAKMGLEAFMKITDDSGGSVEQSKHGGLPVNAAKQGRPSDSGCFTCADCLLSQEEMIENSFPCSLVISDFDTSEFITITEWPKSEDEPLDDLSSLPIFAVDCEMVQTGVGHELARVSFVNESLECVYDTLVKPPNPVLDYVTKYSGISAEMLAGVTTTLRDVHEWMKSTLPPRFILTGHSLENDLKALKLFHPYVIDTSCLFTPHATPLMKPSLKRLTKKLLDKDIQIDAGGHNSIEDAVSCMKLVQKKLREGPDLTIPFNEPSSEHDNKLLLPYLASHLVSTAIIDKPSITGMFGKGLTKCVNVNSDTAALSETKQLMAQRNTRFLFVQLHGMEQYLKFGERSQSALTDVMNTLDEAVWEIFNACPPEYLMTVVAGSSYLAEVRRLQQQEVINYPALEREVMTAREGIVAAVITPGNTTPPITPVDPEPLPVQHTSRSASPNTNT